MRGSNAKHEPDSPDTDKSGAAELVTKLIEREVKIDLNALPPYDEYSMWRFHFEVALLNTSVDDELVEQYLDDLADLEFEEIDHKALPKELRTLDTNIYAAVI